MFKSLLVCVVGKIYREAWVVDPLLLLLVHLKLVVVHLDLAVLEPSLEALAPMGGSYKGNISNGHKWL